MKTTYLKIVLPILLGIGCLFVPLLRNFHIESAITTATIGCFWAGWAAAGKRDAVKSDGSTLLSLIGSVYLFGFVLFIHAIIIGCFSFYGLGYWLLYPCPSILFGYSIGRLLRILGIPFRRVIVIILLLAVAVGVWLLEFSHLPQVYFFNQVWGGWPGPIYDETLKPGWSLVAFRVLTLAWAGFLWWIWEILHSGRARIICIICAFILIAGYGFLLANIGITSPTRYLQKELGSSKGTRHFALYYDKNYYTKDDIGFIAQKEEFYYHQITKRLNISRPEGAPKIQSYLYGNVWQKNRLVGAKYTSYVPLWLDQDQLHIAKGQIQGSLKHELVHVLAKQFGNKLINASWSIGLVEGLAVALAGSQSPVSTIDEIVRSEKPYPTAKQMKQALSFWGFYGGQATVNYIQSGSFVRYLLNNYPVKEFKKAYHTSNIEQAYHTSFKKLVNGWHQSLDTVKVDSTDKHVAAALYGVPSLFEQKCPHVQSKAARLMDHFSHNMAQKDTTGALSYLNTLHKLRLKKGVAEGINATWTYLQLKTGRVQKVQQNANLNEQSAGMLLLYADAFSMTGKDTTAEHYVSKAAQILGNRTNSALSNALNTRLNPKVWHYYKAIVYQQKAVSDSVFRLLDVHTQARAVKQALNRQHWGRLKRYARVIAQDTLNPLYFDIYDRTIQWLAYLNHDSVAALLLRKLRKLPLRKRYEQRLEEAKKWVHFEMSQHSPKKAAFNKPNAELINGNGMVRRLVNVVDQHRRTPRLISEQEPLNL